MTFLRDRSIGIKVLIPPLILIAALGVVVLLAVYGLDRQHDALTAVDDLALSKMTDLAFEALAPIADSIALGIQQKRAEAALQAYSTRLEDRVAARTQELRAAQERLAVLGQLAGGVAHELRNPLDAINNAAYFLGITLADPEPNTREALAIQDREVRAADRIISSLLDFARVKYPSRRAVDVNAVIEQTLAQVAVSPTVQVVRRLDARLPLIQADAEQLAQVFGNLLSNAVQAMPAGGELVVISEPTPPAPLSAREGGDDSPLLVGEGPGVRLTIRDTGSGIAPEHLDKIFEPLFTTKAKGIGLGLALVKMLVEGHGGSIQVTSEVGRGAAFTVTLPTDATAAAHGAEGAEGEESHGNDSRHPDR